MRNIHDAYMRFGMIFTFFLNVKLVISHMSFDDLDLNIFLGLFTIKNLIKKWDSH